MHPRRRITKHRSTTNAPPLDKIFRPAAKLFAKTKRKSTCSRCWRNIRAIDTQPNKLYRNNRNGTRGRHHRLHCLSEDGVARAGMGVDAADYDSVAIRFRSYQLHAQAVVGPTIGAVVLGTGKNAAWQMLRSGSSYLSQNELVLTFGLGGNPQTSEVEAQWPSGQVDRLQNVAADQTITVQEGYGVISSRKYSQRSE